MVKKLIIVPHTHWDREWFDTFEVFRLYLVEFMDTLIRKLETEERIPSFLLDGQMSLIEDYLEVRPLMRERLERLARAGRITLGPWYVQPDEFLVSGEALIKNLQIGLAEARSMGAPLLEGYVPDTFGHIMQLPQILRGFGISTFYAMRGLGEDIETLGTEFAWRSPDGSTVAFHYLAESYSNAGIIAATPEETAVSHGKTVSYGRLEELVSRMSKRSRIPALLLLNGSDHTALQDNLAENIASLSAYAPVVLGKLSDFGDLLREHQNDFPVIEGELGFGRYQPILKDVISARIYLKQLNTQAEELLCVEAERFNTIAACLGGIDRTDFLRRAWKELLKNHAHDSICGCSVDPVHDEMIIRFRHVLDVARYVSASALEELAFSVISGNREQKKDVHEFRIPLVVFNPSPWERSGFAEALIVPLKDSPLGKRIFGYSVPTRDFEDGDLVIVDDSGECVAFETGVTKLSVLDILLRRKVLFQDTLRFYAEKIPPMGYRIFQAALKDDVARDGTNTEITVPGSALPLSADASLQNEYIRVRLNPNGTLSIEDLRSGAIAEGLNLFTDEADRGDEYTFSALPGEPALSTSGLEWHITAGGNCLTGETVFYLPASVNNARTRRSDKKVPCSLVTTVEITPNDRLVRIRTCFDNRAMDHRLRVCFPLGFEPTESIAETAFGLVHRPIRTRPCEGWREAASGNYAEQRFVIAENKGQGVIVFNKGLPEYEVTPKDTLSLTLLRCVDWLSRDDLPLRPGQVGPQIPTPGAQCRGEQIFEYGIYLFSDGLEQVPVFRIAEEFQHPLSAAACQTKDTGHGFSVSSRTTVPGSFCSIDNPCIVLSALTWEQNALVARMYNPFGRAEEFSFNIHVPVSEVIRISLDGREYKGAAPKPGECGFSDIIEANTIATYRFAV